MAPASGPHRAILVIVPFTLAHPAAAIPFRRTRLIMSAVVMGCCVPDFPYFFFQSQRSAFGHSVAGLFALDLPLGVAALWVFHALVKQPLMMFLPRGVRRRLTTSVGAFRFAPLGRFALIVLSVLIGAATHLAWDAFTHDEGWVYWHWSLLRKTHVLPVAGAIQMYKLLEYASSAAGVVVVAVWIWYWYRATRPSAELAVEAVPGRAVVVILPVVAIVGGAVRAYLCDGIALEIRPLVHFTADLVVAAISIFLLGLLILGLVLRGRRPVAVRV